MKILPLISSLTAAALTLFAVGCATTETLDKRIEQKADLFTGLTPEEQNQIRAGIIRPGFSPDMVYMALGKPERVIPGSGPGQEDWLYHNYYGPTGSSVQMPTRIRTISSSGKSSVGGRTVPTKDGYNNTYQVEYDTEATNINIKDESAIKVLIKFTEGTVADIQIINNGTGH